MLIKTVKHTTTISILSKIEEKGYSCSQPRKVFFLDCEVKLIILLLCYAKFLLIFHVQFCCLAYSVREYWRFFVLVSIFYTAIKKLVFLPQLSIIDIILGKKEKT